MYRILIADDEKTIRDGVANYLKKHCSDYEVAGMAEDGEEALKLAQLLLPEVIITDIAMPKMDGLDFLEHITHLLPDTRLIILSGYDNFEYARQAMRLGVREYLVKPLNTKALLRLLTEFKEALDQEKCAWNRLEQLKEMKTARAESDRALCYKEIILADGYFSGPPAGQPEQCFLCVLGRAQGEAEIAKEAIAKRFPEMAETFSTEQEKLVVVFCFPQNRASESFLKVNMGLISIANHFRTQGLGTIHFLAGEMVDSPGRLKDSFRQAKEAAEYVFTDRAAAVINYRDVLSEQSAACACPPEELMRELSLAVNYGSEDKIKEKVDKLFTWFEQNEFCHARYIRNCLKAAAFGVLASLKQVFVSQLEMQQFHEAVNQARAFSELNRIFFRFACLLGDRRKQNEQKRRSLSEEVDFIIQQNMGNPDFSLDDVAGLLFISPNYLRQLFKQETGITFVEYLTRVRLTRAKNLLAAGEMLVSDVAQMVGYRDPRYFSSCFKKLFQVSPSEYPVNHNES